MDVEIVEHSATPFMIPVACLGIGLVMTFVPQVATVGKLVLYFGAQAFMNIYMSWLMRTSVTLPAGYKIEATGELLEKALTGCPASFGLTAMQQIISFLIFLVFVAGASCTPYHYTPKKLNGTFEIMCVIIFGCVFAMNIALNNFSFVYINMATNLIIRSSMPLTTLLTEQMMSFCGLYPLKPCKVKEVVLMVLGVLCAGVFTWARIMGSAAQGRSSSNMLLGATMCFAAMLCGSLNLALAGVLGEMKLNIFDTVAYMSIPAALFLLPIAMFLRKEVPGEWPKVFGASEMTDFEILKGIWAVDKLTMVWLCLSGPFALIYNLIQFSIVQTLSPAATAFGGNFNKAVLIFLSLLLPFLRVHELPGAPWIVIIWGAVIVNILVFSYYSYLQIKAKQEEMDEEEMDEDTLEDHFSDTSESDFDKEGTSTSE